MATLVLSTVGGAAGTAIGGPIGGAVGRVLGALAGGVIDGALAGSDSPRAVEGPRLKDMDGLTSTEGAPIPRVYGRARVGGQLIWATRFEEVVTVTPERAAGQGGKGSARGARTDRTTYSYFANLAVGLCEGPISFVRRVWADGRELDLTTLTLRVHRGAEDQEPDPLIVAKEKAENAPAYRGLAYVVFERLPLAEFGNRVPQFSFEVVRAVNDLGPMIRAVCLIPGATEFGYETAFVGQKVGIGATRPENRHQFQAASDVIASLDALQALCPNLRRVSLVASWFGDDLRAGHCTMTPRVESAIKSTYDAVWSVGGLGRGEARVVSRAGGVAAYGGTPSDESVVRLIHELKARGLEVVLYPFVMMDVAAGNALPDPWTGGASQAPYPWRGRITCHPAPGRPGTPDGTAAAGAQAAAFFGTAASAHFTADAEAGHVTYNGPDAWGFRRLILHYAHLAVAAGGVDAFIIGSELVGLTRVRAGPGDYPAVTHLAALAADVRAVLGAAPKIAYAADWTEYNAHVLGGGAEVRFPLDPLWAHPAIDAVGIDYYPPISDWRDGPSHRDLAEARTGHDLAYLRDRLASGEAFDWYYASPEDRAAQIRSPITDGASGKPWIFRAKDLAGWWSNPHVERVGGAETTPTAWVPRSKPIWLTEIGIPAVDKGPNGPNVFPDPKLSESAVPPFSHGTRDDLAQSRGLEAILTRFDPVLPGHPDGANPTSPLYGGPMVDPAAVAVWAWDARPFPAFPDFDLVWADGGNWDTGHWVTGRLEGAPLDRLVAAILADFGLAAAELAIEGFVDGYVIDRPMSARAALEPLTRLFGVDAVASGRDLVFRGRGSRAVVTLDPGELALAERTPALRLVRAQETELPRQIELGFTEGRNEYRRAAVASRRLEGLSRRETQAEVAAVLDRSMVQRLADSWLQDLWAARETAEFALSPRAVSLEPGDIVSLPTKAGARLHRITRIADGPLRQVSSRAVEPAVFAAPTGLSTRPPKRPPVVVGRPEAIVLDLAAARDDPPALSHIAVAAEPWPGAVSVWRSADGASFALHRTLEVPAMAGTTLGSLPPGPLWRWDDQARLDIVFAAGSLRSVSDEAALSGENLFAVRGADGRWEIFGAARAELVAERTWRLSRLLRGLAGSEPEAFRVTPAGATVVRLDAGVRPLADALSDLGVPWRYRVVPAGRDHADPSAVAFVATAGPEALKPLAPVHVSARRTPEGVRLAWVRRTRRDGDAWEPLEVPLGEDREAYEVDILQGASVVRRLAADAPLVLYPAAEELAHFGAPQSILSVRIAQLSAAVGRGFDRTETITVA